MRNEDEDRREEKEGKEENDGLGFGMVMLKAKEKANLVFSCINFILKKWMHREMWWMGLRILNCYFNLHNKPFFNSFW